MVDFFTSSLSERSLISGLEVFVRLVVALTLGALVAAIYRRTRKTTEIMASFPTTLVLLSILIAMVTQVIGDNVARAFSLVGALSIVRFRTVVRDTLDTAFVIFSVAVGMAVGAQHWSVALIGIVVVAAVCFWRKMRVHKVWAEQPAFLLTIRIGVGDDPSQLLGNIFDTHLQERELISAGTGKQGTALDMTYETRLRPGTSLEVLVNTLSCVQGVQSTKVTRRGIDPV